MASKLLKELKDFSGAYTNFLSKKEDYALGNEHFLKELKRKCGKGTMKKYRPVSTNGFLEKVAELIKTDSIILLKDTEYFNRTPSNKPLFGQITYALIINTKGLRYSARKKPIKKKANA